MDPWLRIHANVNAERKKSQGVIAVESYSIFERALSSYPIQSNEKEVIAVKMTEIRSIAKERNISPGRMKKQDLVRTIQLEENNVPCFQTAVESCDQGDCCWRSDCLPKNIR